MQQTFTTPMMKQYVKIKENYKDCLLFYRMGDFYELFMEDASIGSQVLNITLTSRAKGKDGRIPMSGVPYHAVDSYITKLVKAGYKVAICEQMSLPNKKGIIDREVVRIVTPGTLLSENALEKKENNYVISLFVQDKTLAMSVADISTGYFATTEISTDNIEETIKDELSRLNPAECILPEELYNDPEILRVIKTQKEINVFPFPAWEKLANDSQQVLKKHFGVTTLLSFGIDTEQLSLQTAAVLLGYLQQTQKGQMKHIKKITPLSKTDYLILDKSTMINLELFSTIREHDIKGTLLSVMDQTQTAMGGRLLKQWMKKPLTNELEIHKRHDAVEKLQGEQEVRQKLVEILQEISDIERLISRLSVGLGNARDLINLVSSLSKILEIKQVLTMCETALLLDIEKTIDPSLMKLITLVSTHIVSEPPIALKEGGLIRPGVNIKLDKLRDITSGSREWISSFEKQEREKTGIASLKVRFNQVFGFYIEISRANLHLAPKSYTRKQTLVNGERFTTPELKVQEEIILTAEEKINELEYILFQEILTTVLQHVVLLQNGASAIAQLDCLLTFSHIAEKNHYIRPTMRTTGEIRIIGGRHPVVEQLLQEKQFVPNDVLLNTGEQLILITGPNMAGKSVYIRQVALIVYMAHLGSFVPAVSADISLTDRIFVRSGASDVITSGLSTFMVEMVETANILHHATKDSLIIMDEIGRGTSTYDGISIAWAVAEYLVTNTQTLSKTLFATHYHELQVLEKMFVSRIKNYHLAVANDQEEPVFLHTILPGGAPHSFGIAVAKLAGIPDPVIKRAQELLLDLEKRQKDSTINKYYTVSEQINIVDRVIHKELEKIDIHQMTPLEAINKLSELKEKIKMLKREEHLQRD